MLSQQFGRLTVVARVKGQLWQCLCSCGNTVTAYGSSLRSRTSCGCAKKEHQLSGNARRRHGHYINRRPTPERRAYSHMLPRCYNNNFPRYRDWGGRGIVVCDRWRESFDNFIADMGFKPSPKHSLDRIDNNGNYEPSNCRWATPSEQQRNKRRWAKSCPL